MLRKTITLTSTFGTRHFGVFRSNQLVDVKHEFHDIIKWNKPSSIPLWDPQRSGDTKPLGKVDSTTLRLEYRSFADIIDKLPEGDRKLFTVGLGRRKDVVDILMDETTSLTKRHKYDMTSPEFKIAKFTIKIRSFQELFETDPKFCKGQQKSRCRECIQKRHKYLTILKNSDIKKFEWILQVLSIIYRPLPEFYELRRRKTALIKLTDMYCDAIRSKRLYDYKLELESQKIPFLEEKLAALEQIKEDEDWMRLPCSVEEEIKETKERIETLKNTPADIQPVQRMELVPTYHVPYTLYRIGETNTSVRY